MLKIKLFRMSKGLSQWELSRGSGMEERYSMIERGLIDPTAEERARLAEAVGAQASTLFRSAIRSRSLVGSVRDGGGCQQ